MNTPMCGLPSTVTIPGPLHLERAIEKLRWAVGGEFSASISPKECEALLAKLDGAAGATGKAGTSVCEDCRGMGCRECGYDGWVAA